MCTSFSDFEALLAKQGYQCWDVILVQKAGIFFLTPFLELAIASLLFSDLIHILFIFIFFSLLLIVYWGHIYGFTKQFHAVFSTLLLFVETYL